MSKPTQPNDVANDSTTKKTFIYVQTYNGDCGWADHSDNTAWRINFATIAEAIAYAKDRLAEKHGVPFDVEENLDGDLTTPCFHACFHHYEPNCKPENVDDSGTIQIWHDDASLYGACIDSGVNSVSFFSKNNFEKDFDDTLKCSVEYNRIDEEEALELVGKFAKRHHVFVDAPDAPSHYVVL